MEPIKDKMTAPKADELKTPAVTVIGWLLILMCPIIMACGYNNGQMNMVFWAGAALVLPGIVCIIIGKLKQKK